MILKCSIRNFLIKNRWRQWRAVLLTVPMIFEILPTNDQKFFRAATWIHAWEKLSVLCSAWECVRSIELVWLHRSISGMKSSQTLILWPETPRSGSMS